MALISPSVLALRRDPRLLKIPPYISALCVLVGVVWLFLLPLDEYSRGTYISENALLPGQVHTYFGGSEESVFHAYKNEVRYLADKSQEETSQHLMSIFRGAGLKVATQRYRYEAARNRYEGENIYAVLHAPRGDATEAIVLVAAWRNMDEQLNQSGVALLLTLARYFKRWSLWSKDIIFLITPDSKAGPQAWVDAYHDTHATSQVDSLTLKSGALQGAVVIDNPLNQRFESLHIVYDGINGQLPNLDLFNTAVSVASGQMGIRTVLQRMWKHDDTYRERLETMLRGMANQGLGHGSGPHSSFIPYHIDAITLHAVGLGWQDEMAMGRCVEGIFRSLNNLLEHLHQSFFFYLLMHANRFVSIGTYLPSAMLVAVNFTIMAISLWIQSGRPPKAKLGAEPKNNKAEKIETELVEKDDSLAVVPKQDLTIIERQLLLPLAIVLALHALGSWPLYVFNNTRQADLSRTLTAFLVFSFVLPTILSTSLSRFLCATTQQLILIKCFSLLLLGMLLATLATLNFSLAFLIGILASPLTFLGVPSEKSDQSHSRISVYATTRRILSNVVLHLTSPPIVFSAVCYFTGISVEEVLKEAAFGWHVWGLWTQVVVWCVWWPAWLIGTMFVSPQL